MSNSRKPRTQAEWTTVSRQARIFMESHEEGLRAELNQVAPGFIDQMKAAMDDPIQQKVQENLMRLGYTTDSDFSSEVADVVNGQFLRMLIGIPDGTTLACPHIRDGAPIPSIAIPWANTLDCYPCAAQRAQEDEPELTEREKYTCDICRKYEDNLQIWENYLRYGPALVYFGACDTCNSKFRKGNAA